MTHEEAMTTADKPYLAIREAATRYRASEADIMRWIGAGLVPARKVNGRWYVVMGVSNG